MFYEQENNLHDEMEDVVKLDFISQSQINTLLEHDDIDDIQRYAFLIFTSSA